MNRLITILFLNLIGCLPITLLGQSAPIALDGIFNDWTSSLATVTDTPENISGIDLLEMQVTNDQEFLFIRIKTNTEFDLMEDVVPQKVRLSLDIDNNPNTGYSIQPGFGSELTIVFRGHSAYYNVTPYSSVTFSDLSLRVSPTITADEFEIAIRRDAVPDGLNPLFTAPTIKILLHNNLNGDKLPNEGTDFLYTFDQTPVAPMVPIDIQKEDTNQIRILAYNTKGNGLTKPDRLPHFEQVVKALNPDIIGFSECGNTDSALVKNLLDAWLPLPGPNGWFIGKMVNEDLITASRWPIVTDWNHLPSQYPTLIDLPTKYPTDLLFTNAHLKWGGNDVIRQDEVDAYTAFILDAKSVGGTISLPSQTPFVYGGDLNFVGSSQQLKTILTGDIQNTTIYGIGSPPDWDNTNIANFMGLQSDKRMDFTWKKETSAYPPGKLDYIIYSDAVIQAEKSFVLRTEVMSNSRLQQYGLLQNNTESASDHYPVVTDFTINTPTGLKPPTTSKHIIYPNPAFTAFNISFNQQGEYLVRIFDAFGAKVFQVETDSKQTSIDISTLPSGIYFIHIIGAAGSLESHKLLKR